jgi:hypothetical protein
VELGHAAAGPIVLEARFWTASRLFPVWGMLNRGVPRFHDISKAPALENLSRIAALEGPQNVD